MNKLLKFIFGPVVRAMEKYLSDPLRRYHSIVFRKSMLLLQFTPQEELLQSCMDFIRSNQLEGDYLEFGVFEGRSFIAAHHLARAYGLAMRFFAFDSFKGMPPSAQGKYEGFTRYNEGRFCCDIEAFKRNLRVKRVDMRSVFFTEGFFDRTLTEERRDSLGLSKAALIMVDCDLYESTVPVLDFVTPLIQDGTLMIFDDWFAYRGHPDHGEQRAFREWLQKNPAIRAMPYYSHRFQGQSFLLHNET